MSVIYTKLQEAVGNVLNEPWMAYLRYIGPVRYFVFFIPEHPSHAGICEYVFLIVFGMLNSTASNLL